MKITLRKVSLLFFLLACHDVFSQASSKGISYTISNPATAYVANAGTVIHAANTDDAISAAIPITFAFKYGGISVTQIWVSSNGFISFANPGGSLPAANLGNTSVPTVAPLWDNLKCGSAGNVNYKFTGANPTRVMTIEWLNMNWDVTGAAASPTVSFQIKLYQDSTGSAVNNFIDFIYRQEATAPSGLPAARNAHIGIAGWCSKDYYSATTANVNILSKTVLTNLNARPATNTRGRFIPVSESNNICTSAQSIAWSNIAQMSFKGSTLQSDSTEIGPPPHTGVCTPLRNDVWFTFTKGAGITGFEIGIDSTCLSTTQMEVYTGACGAAMTLVGCYTSGMAGFANDPYINITGQPCASTTYYVRVQSDNTTPAYFRLVITPPGRSCAFANIITSCLPLPYTSPTLSNCGFGFEVDSTLSPCHNSFNKGEDYVFQYTPPVDQCVNVSLTGTPANSSPAFFIYSYCPTGGGSSCLGEATGSGGSPLSFNNLSLSAGIPYYFVIDNDTSNLVGCLNNYVFNLSASTSNTPSNDLCANAKTLTPVIGTTCTGPTNDTVSCATATPPLTYTNPSGCGNFTDGVTADVWFNFTASNTNPHVVKVDLGTVNSAADLSVAVYSSTGPCTGLSFIGCDDNSNGAGMPSYTFIPSIGTTYYIRIFANDGSAPGLFRICVLSGCSPPNDFPNCAVSLPISVTANGSNSCSTNLIEPAAPSCWTNGSGQINTVWYKFQAPASGNVKIKTRLVSLTDSQIGLYQGSCPGGACATACVLSLVAGTNCNDNTLGACTSGFYTYRESELNVATLTPGNFYWISVDGKNSATGTFDITVYDNSLPIPPISGQDCQLATALCASTYNVVDPGFQGTGNICDMPPPGGANCFSGGEKGSSWYTVTMSGPGLFQFHVTPNGVYDYDFFVWRIDTVTDYCSKLNNISAFPYTGCHWIDTYGSTGLDASAGTSTASQGGSAFGPAYWPAYPVSGGEKFLIMVSDWTNNSTVGYTLDLLTSPVSPTPAILYWQNAVNSTWNDQNNWTPDCDTVPACSKNQSAVITNVGVAPIVTGYRTVKDLTINPGSTLTIASGATLEICGNFSNFGTFVCQNNATVIFAGTGVQNVIGTFNAANKFWHVIVNKTTGSVKLNTNIYIGGNYSVNLGIVDNGGNKTTTVEGNFYNYNGATSFTNLGAGFAGTTITFAGGAAQSYTNLVSNLTLNNVVINQSVASSLTLGAGAFNDLILGTSGVLTLTNGKIITGARRVDLTNNAVGATTAGNANSYIEGNLRRAIPTFTTPARTYEYPVGETTKGYQRFSTTYTYGPATAYTISARFRTWAPLPVGGPSSFECLYADWSVNPPYDNGYWTLDASNTSLQDTFNVNAYPLNYTNDIGGAPNGYSVMKANSNNGVGPFSMQGNCNYPGTGVNPVSRLALVDFSDFGVVQFGSPLPIELLYFSAEPKEEGVITTWSTSSEINNERFEIEKSFSGLEFEKIGTVPGYGAGICTQKRDYSFLDREICNGLVYYRLKQVDINGQYTYSDVVAVKCHTDKSVVNVYPNPANDVLNIGIDASADKDFSVKISDVYGRLVFERNYEVKKGLNKFVLSISDWSSGVYHLDISEGEKEILRSSRTFVKQ